MSDDRETKEDSGVLFRSKDKRKEKSPDYWGRARVGAVDYRVVAWVNESKSGSKYLSLKFEIEDVEAKPARAPRRAPPPRDDDDLPF